jgi:hypothetical protein
VVHSQPQQLHNARERSDPRISTRSAELDWGHSFAGCTQLETDLGAKGNLPIVRNAVGENHLVADIDPHPEGAKERFDSAARV